MDEINKKGNIRVSICCATYNHENFIRQCLDGFLMQRVNFPIEILIHDDASSDKTADIIREYEVKYPNIIKPIYQKQNQYSKGVKVSLKYQYSRAKGKYIALCEGDDYWTDPYKLQKQVDFLETHNDFVMCSHKIDNYYEQSKTFSKNYVDISDPVIYKLKNLISGEWYYQPLSVIFRRDCLNLEEYRQYQVSMDAVLFYHLLKKGKGYFIPEMMAIYRIHSGGIWSKVGLDRQRLMEFNARIGICKVENSRDSAIFLLNQFTKLISRKWMLKNWKIMITSFRILTKHFGLGFALDLFVSKLVFNKLYKHNGNI